MNDKINEQLQKYCDDIGKLLKDNNLRSIPLIYILDKYIFSRIEEVAKKVGIKKDFLIQNVLNHVFHLSINSVIKDTLIDLVLVEKIELNKIREFLSKEEYKEIETFIKQELLDKYKECE